MTSKPVLGYWKIRGLAQPIRLLLHYVKEEFEDKQYEVGPAPEFSTTCWMDEKMTLGLDFPNLPYYIHGDVKLTQSNAILRYIGRKYKLDGETEQQKQLVDMMENTAMDFRNEAVRLFYNPKFEELKANYLENLEKRLKQFEDYMANKTYFAGDTITFVDFPMYELLDQNRILDPACLGESPNLRKFMERMEALDQIKDFIASEEFKSKPINNKMAAFGNK